MLIKTLFMFCLPPYQQVYALATVADERNGYLAGVYVLFDGDSTNGKLFKKKSKNNSKTVL